MNTNRLFRAIAVLCLSWTCLPLCADEPTKKEETKPSPVEARLIVKKSKYVLPKEQHGKAFRKRIEEETDSDKLPAPQEVNLVLELKNISQEDVMIWPRGAITYPDLTIEGPGVVRPESLTSLAGESGATGVQPTIEPGKTHRLTIKSLNPNGGTTWFYWNEPGEYTITASYTVHTGLPPFPFPDDKKPVGKPQRYEVTTPPVKVQVVLEAGPLDPGDHTRTVLMGEQKRTYLVHVPKDYDPKKPAPVVLALHGAAMDGSMMVWFSGLNKKSDESGFIVVYPSGTGVGPFRTWNAGGFSGKMAEGKADDVAFIGKLLDDLNGVVKMDEKRVYACGMSNGGMMCYRLAAELSDRIAAIAPVAGTIAIEESKPKRPVPVIHFHGSKDNIVPFVMTKDKTPAFMKFKGVEDSIQSWVKLNGCDEKPTTETISKKDDEIKVTRTCYGGGKDGSEVVLIVIEEGGHTWPGQKPPVGFIGQSAKNVSANDLMWEFFQRHKLK